MGHTFSKHVYHVVFSTRGRERSITPALAERLVKYIGGIARKTGGVLLEAGAADDHVHLLVQVRPDVSVAKFVGTVKANSSRWASRHLANARGFSWQAGYASFTVSESNTEAVASYVRGQQEHHRRFSFSEELARLLERHGISFDPEHYLD